MPVEQFDPLFRNKLIDKPTGVIRKLLRNLDDTQFTQLINLLINLIDNIVILFHIEEKYIPNFLKKLEENNFRDVLGLFLLLLPYIDNLDELQNIKYLEEIYTTRHPSDKVNNPQQSTPRYLFTNIQYNRCIREPFNLMDFNMSHIEHNYTLLLKTIQTVANRLYVNWTNIVPVIDYKTTSIYTETSNAIRNSVIDDEELFINNSLPIAKHKHLFIGTIYETIYSQLYEKIKNIKWLIYNVLLEDDEDEIIDTIQQITEKNKNSISVIQWLEQEKIISASEMYQGISWDKLSKNTQETLESDWSKIFNRTDENRNVLRYIIIFFEKYYQQIDKIENYTIISQIKKNKRDELTFDILVEQYKKIPFNHLYEFISQSYYKFRQTIYYKLLNIGNIESESKLKLDIYPNPPIYQDGIRNQPIVLTSKNLFNFAKNFCNYTQNGKYTQLPKRWVSLDNTMRKLILDRINKKDRSWFNITRNLKINYPNIGISTDAYTQFIRDVNIYIYRSCFRNLSAIIFECLISSGTLSTFVDKIQVNLENYDNCNYYLTNEPYKNLNELWMPTQDGEKSGLKKITYREFNTPSVEDRRKWYDAYAMDWISQINFFHKYLNNRVIFATGGTGVGKSTQLPKLLMYATKMIDCKDAGIVIDSQPRKRPTEGNAERVADEMGVPIRGNKSYDGKSREETSNYYVQYKHHDSSHSLSYASHPILRFVTDKILLNNLSNPILKKKFNDNYSSKNIYDIVIVDESHEHNENMDMILTLMKNVLYYNNECKLVIVSATMEDDEPIYRRFYRDINDNLMYPLNTFIEENSLDRINVDRRLDISIPFMKNNFIITEKYLGDTEDIPKDETERNFYIAKKINEILQNPSTKDILVFKTGKKEIDKCVEVLNVKTLADTIAIPYYGDLREDIRSFVENVHKKHDELRISKDVNIGEVVDVSMLQKGTGQYKHIIIVATNIAEASITIDTLTDVFDEGMQKVAIYSPRHNGVLLKEGYISIQSQKQRRGRVGRTMNGRVHYLYKSGTLDNVRNIYKICIGDITDTLLAQLRTENSPILFTDATDPNQLSIQNNPLNNQKNIDTIMKNQYYINNKRYTYNGVSSQYDYQNSIYNHQLYEDGYDMNRLLDTDGTFYIIHPNESFMRRNILGRIIEYPQEDRIALHLRKPIDVLLVVEKEHDMLKSLYGKAIIDFAHNVFLDANALQYTIACCFADAYGCLDEIVKIISMIQVMSTKRVELTSSKPKCSSDLLGLLELLNRMLIIAPCFIQNDDEEIKRMTKDNETCIIEKIPQKLLEDDKSLYFSCVSQYLNNMKKVKSADITTCSKYINRNYVNITSGDYDMNQKITAVFLHAFGHNIVIKMEGTDLYVPQKYPIKTNIKKIMSTSVSAIYLSHYVMYININIRDDVEKYVNSIISMIHYIDPKLLNIISYQHNLLNYTEIVTQDNPIIKQKQLDEKARPTHTIIRRYENVIQQLLSDIKKFYKSNTTQYFQNISQYFDEIISKKEKSNLQFLN